MPYFPDNVTIEHYNENYGSWQSMGLVSFSIAIFLLGISLFAAGGLFWLMFGPLITTLRGSQGGSKVRKAEAKLKKVDELIASASFQEALKLLRKAVVLDSEGGARNLTRLKDLHQNMLSRCLVLAEEADTRADNVAQVEHLLMERIELQGLLLKAEASFNSLRTRREQAGKEIPSWSKSDFQTRITEISSELKKNSAAVERALNDLFRMLGEKSGDSIVYH